jgi:hypothetical protein
MVVRLKATPLRIPDSRQVAWPDPQGCREVERCTYHTEERHLAPNVQPVPLAARAFQNMR